MIDYPFRIPNYGMIQNEDALKLFMKFYNLQMDRLQQMLQYNEELSSKIPIDIILHIDGGVLQDVAVFYPELVKVTLIDMDNIEQEEKDDNVVYITLGNYPVNKIETEIKDHIQNLLGDYFNLILEENENV